MPNDETFAEAFDRGRARAVTMAERFQKFTAEFQALEARALESAEAFAKIAATRLLRTDPDPDFVRRMNELMAEITATNTWMSESAAAPRPPTPPAAPRPMPVIGGLQMRWLCDYCFAMSSAAPRPASWHALADSYACPDCWERGNASDGPWRVTPGAYAEGPDPRLPG